MNRFLSDLHAYYRALWKALVRAFAEIFEVFAAFPTAIADLLTPLLGLEVKVGVKAQPQRDIEARIEHIAHQLRRSGSEAQDLLNELDQLMQARADQLNRAQTNLLSLQLEESVVQERVDALKSVQPEAAAAINALLGETLEERDKRGRARDWLIFGLGVVMTVIVSFAFFWLSR